MSPPAKLSSSSRCTPSSTDTIIKHLEERVVAIENSGDAEVNSAGSSNHANSEVTRLACESVANNIILKGIKLHRRTNNSRNETIEETREIIDKLHSDLGVEVEGCFESIRYGISTQNKEPVIVVKYWTAEGKKDSSHNWQRKNPQRKVSTLKSSK